MQKNEYELIYWTLGSGFALVAYLLLALRLLGQGYLRSRFDGIKFSMVAATVVTAAWGVLGIIAGLFDQRFLIGVQAADILRYFWWFLFLYLFFGYGKKERHEYNKKKFLIGFGFFIIVAPLFVILMNEAFGYFGNTFLMMLLALCGLIMVEQLFRNIPEDSLWSAKPLCLALAATFIFDLYVFSQGVLFKGLDADALRARPFVHALMVPLLWLATSRHRNWIDNIRISRKVVFHSATLVLAGLYLLFIAGVGYYVRFFGGDWGGALQLGLVFVSLVLASALAFSRSLRAKLRVFLGKHFFHYQFDYREEWLKFTATLSSQVDPQEAGQSVVKGLADMLECPAGALWLLRPDEDNYRQVARWNLPPCSETENQDSHLVKFMLSTEWVVNLDEFHKLPALYPGLQLPLWLAQFPQAWLIVPLWQGKNLLGFVILARSRTPVNVNWEVTDLLKTAGHQAASLLSQMQSTEALLESRKFEAFTRMSAFVVHDLKNIVAQLSLMMKNAKRLQGNPEFQADMLMTVENSLERMRQLMLQLRGGTTPDVSAFGVDLAKVAERLFIEAQQRGRHIQLDVSDSVFIRGERERLERIIGHLIHNALDATEPEKRVWIKVFRMGSQACVEVGDHGCGMTEEFVQNRLFKPFQTTKEAGMGIGSYESFQYVRELGGRVSVESQVGKGTVVKLNLPLVEISRKSDLHRTETA